MALVPAYAAAAPGAALKRILIARREPLPRDVDIEILFCGVCHSDIHTARGEWGRGVYPVVPGHEIAGRVRRVGRRVRRFKPGDLVGVGCLAGSCGACAECRSGLEQHCRKGPTFTYGSPDRGGRPTYGGYSKSVVVDERFVLRMPRGLPLERAAPLLCAGITVYSPLRRHGAGRGRAVGVLGLGGLGHMAVKLARALGAEATAIGRSPGRGAEARRLGAARYVCSRSPASRFLERSLDLVIDTASGPHDLSQALGWLKTGGVLSLVGASPEPLPLPVFSVIGARRSVAGSLIGGIAETQEMLDFCARRGVLAEAEVLPAARVNQAFARLLRGDVRYRFVLDLAGI